jgi:exodeoxyribonuclease VII large subunit
LRHLARDLSSGGAAQISARRTTLETIAGRLHALSPLATLSRGYSVARAADGATLTSAASFHDGMPFDLVVRDGTVPARVHGTPAPGEAAS